jgi:hypothetical protein
LDLKNIFDSDNLNNNPDDVEIDLTETNFNSVPDYVAMERKSTTTQDATV